MTEFISLYQLNQLVQEAIKDALPGYYWIKAEISDIRLNRNGHCYLELIEKEEDGDKINAKASAIIWSHQYRMIRAYFESTTGQELSAGLMILVQVSVEFHELYGYSLSVKDIDPNYTLGDLARKRMEVIQKLKEEGVFDMNKELGEPLVYQKIAVVSSPTAAGYEDFIKQLQNNSKGLKFYVRLFPAIMQGDKTESSIIEALEGIFRYEDFFDCVVIIRGGGAQSELHAFNGYWLAYNICQFPIPVITGIGHERDHSIADMVAHTSLKTPTATAEYLIEKMNTLAEHIENLENLVVQTVNEIIGEEKQGLELSENRFHSIVKGIVKEKNNQLSFLVKKMQIQTNSLLTLSEGNLTHFSTSLQKGFFSLIKLKKQRIEELQEKTLREALLFFKEKKHQLDIFINTTKHIDPENVLKKGYSITTLNGKALKDANAINPGDEIETRLYKGNIKSKIL